jgi:putative membrane protein
MMHYGRGIFNNGMWDGFMNNGWSLLIGIGILLIIVVVTYLIVKRNQNTVSNSNALESLKVKFAQGEITEEEYKKRKSVLEEK